MRLGRCPSRWKTGTGRGRLRASRRCAGRAGCGRGRDNRTVNLGARGRSAPIARDDVMGWRIRGTYFESCNCDAICPCRRIDGVPGGRSTHGVCLGVLSWLIGEGAADGTDLSGNPVALASRYSDDEPGSPWTWILYLDARASEAQRAAFEAIFTGRLGGDAERHFPWAWKLSELVAARAVEFEVDHTRRRQRFRIRDLISVRIRDRYEGGEQVTCVIPGHERADGELVADELVVEDGALAFNYRGVCGYDSTLTMRASGLPDRGSQRRRAHRGRVHRRALFPGNRGRPLRPRPSSG